MPKKKKIEHSYNFVFDFYLNLSRVFLFSQSEEKYQKIRLLFTATGALFIPIIDMR